MVPTPTPAPPMPMQAMPAPMYFAAIGSMTRAPLVDPWMDEPLVARMQRIVEVDAGENGEHVGLQHRDQQLQRGERDGERERQDRAERAPPTRRAQQDDETRGYLSRDGAGEHARQQAHAVRDPPHGRREYLYDDD